MKQYKLLISGIIAGLILSFTLWNIRVYYPQKPEVTHTQPTYSFLNPFSPDLMIPAEKNSSQGWGYQYLVYQYPTRWFFVMYDLTIGLGIGLIIYSAFKYNRVKKIPNKTKKPRIDLIISLGAILFILILLIKAYRIMAIYSLYF